jgi:hypothetical protein
MAITNIITPQVTTPAYNPIRWEIDSSNVNNTGFRYVVDVYDSTPTKIAEYRLVPRITDGYGEIDLSKLLSTYVDIDLDTAAVTSYDATNSYFEYSVEFGEEYNESYAYTGFGDSGGYVQLTGVGTHSFVVGDQINLTESTPATNPLLTGLHTITAQTASTLTLDIVYADLVSPSSIAGSVIYADNRKTINRSMDINSSYYVFNGVLPWLDFRSYDDADYTLGATDKKFLCNFPSNYQITPDQDLWVNWIPATNNVRWLVFENSDGDVLYKVVTSSSGEWVIQESCGAGNVGTLSVSSGTLPLVKSTTEWYDIYWTDNVLTQLSEKKRITIDNRCKIEDFEIIFLDRLGSIGSFNFMNKAMEKGKIKKQDYNQNIQGEPNGTSLDWTYDTTAAGFRPFDIKVDKTFTLNTNWMTLEMNQYFEELLTSYYTYIKIDSVYQRCLIQEGGFETTRQRGKKLMKKTVTVKLSNQDSING